MKRFVLWGWLRDNWGTLAAGLVLGVGLLAVLRFQLFSLVPGTNPHERVPITIVEAAEKPWESGVAAPYYLAVRAVRQVVADPVQAARLTSAIIGLASIICFCWLLQLWFNASTALLGGILLATSSWFLLIARMGAPFIMLIAAPLAIMVATMFLISSKRKTLPFLLLAGVTSLALYIPYMCWFIAAGYVLLFIRNKYLTHKVPTPTLVAGAVVFLLVATPLLISLVREPSQLRALTGIPASLPSVMTYLGQLLDVALSLFVRSPVEASLHLGTLPLLDIFTSVMFVLGAHYYWSRLSLKRSVILFGSLLGGSLIIALSPDYQANMALLIAPTFILITTGVYELLKQWLIVFPRNPIARAVGLACMLTAVASVSFYHLNRYFIARPNAPETKAAYQSVTIE